MLQAEEKRHLAWRCAENNVCVFTWWMRVRVVREIRVGDIGRVGMWLWRWRRGHPLVVLRVRLGRRLGRGIWRRWVDGLTGSAVGSNRRLTSGHAFSWRRWDKGRRWRADPRRR